MSDPRIDAIRIAIENGEFSDDDFAALPADIRARVEAAL